MTHIASAGRLDATTLVEKLRDQLPVGSTQNYAAILVLNYLNSYSEQNGLQIEEQGRLAVTALSLEFLYLAWHNGVGIELSERQLEASLTSGQIVVGRLILQHQNWPLHVWKNSANLNIDLHSLVKQPNLRLIHDRLRDVRTLLSFGAVVNRYHELIQFQAGGMKAFVQTYQPVELDLEELEPPSPLPAPSPLRLSFPGAYSIGSNSKTNDSSWSWFPWPRNRIPKNQSTAPLEPPKTLGSTLQPSVEALPLYTTESSVHFHLVSHGTTSSASLSPGLLSSCDSGLTSSSGTSESITTTQISALERLEAYLSVLGTPQCEPIKPVSLRKPRLVSLAETEKAVKARTLQGPIRKPIQLPSAQLTLAVQRKLPGPRNKPIRSLRWMTGEELKSRNPFKFWKPVDHRLKVLKGDKRSLKLKLEPVSVGISGDVELGIGVVGEVNHGSKIPSVSPLKSVKCTKTGSV